MKLLVFMSFAFNFFLCSENVKSGLDVLEEDNFNILNGKSIAVIANHTSIDLNGQNIVDILIKNNIKVKAIFSPEHGFYGDITGGYNVLNSTYASIPVYSLYGKNKRPDETMLQGLDAIVFDIQDVGTRFYTYLTTMGYAMEEAGKRKIEFIVLDRPNPVSSDVIEGPILSNSIKSFTAYYNVPIRHSLTAGEMAIFHKTKDKIDINLTVVKMKNYKRNMLFNETGLQWVNPSPNIRNLNAALLYPGIGCFESTNISVGRGTEFPFEFFGSPWMDNKKISEDLNKAGLDGVEFYPVELTPDDDLYKGEKIKGVHIKVIDQRAVRSVDIFVNAIYLINKYHSDRIEIRTDEIAKMVGNYDFLDMLKSGKKPNYILKKFEKDINKFKKYLKKNNIKIY
jgi:uncharacterized protein YbbC (DUF1343 family)